MFNITETHITIMVKDMDKSVDFYQKLGFIVLQRWENHYAMLTINDTKIGLHPSNTDTAGSGNVSVGFIVEDSEEVKSYLTELGIVYQAQDDKSGIFVSITDPDGTIIYYMQPKVSW